MSGELNMTVKGKIVEFVGAVAIVKTDLGNAYLDIDEPFHRLKIGDKIEAWDMRWYPSSGQIVSVLGERYKLNEMWVTYSELQPTTRGDTP